MFAHRPRPRVGVVIGLVAVLGCSPAPHRQVPTATTLGDRTIEVASFDFLESRILAELYSQAIENGGYRVHRSFGIGPRELVDPALAVGLVELVPEYSGTATAFFTLGRTAPSRDPDTSRHALRTALGRRSITALAPTPGQDSNAFAVTRETAARLRVHRLSDLVRAAPTLTFGGPAECPSRPLCLGGLRRVYDLEFDQVVTLDAGGPLTREALAGGAVDVALLFSTDPALDDEFVALEDDRGLQPAENITPLIRDEVLRAAGPELAQLIDAVSAALTTDQLRELNAAAEAHPARIGAVARRWLAEEGLR